MGDTAIIVVTITGAVILVGIAVGIAILGAKKRSRRIESVGESLGLTYLYKAEKKLVKELPDLALFKASRIRHVYHLLTYPEDRRSPITFFDFMYMPVTSRSAYVQTVALLRDSGIDLPEFEARPRGLAAKIGEKLGLKSIEFPGNPGFMERCELTGGDESAIRSVLTGSLLETFASQPKLRLDAAGNAAVLYRFNVRVKPEDYGTFIETAEKIFSELTS